MREAVKAAGKTAEIVVYPESQHGFLADYRPSYDPVASKDAWAKMLAFFARHGVAPAPKRTASRGTAALPA
jgi:carboxymethylenebutenolidase